MPDDNLKQDSVVVANPGHVAWMTDAAAGLSEAGLLRTLITPLASTPAEAQRAENIHPRLLGRRVGKELRRRMLPPTIDPTQLERAAMTPELCAVASKRIRANDRTQRAVADWRDRRFDRAVSRRLLSGDSAALLGYCAALESIQAARRLRIHTVVEYPVHHHAFAARLLSEEFERAPEYAHTMQFHSVPEARRDRLDAEIRDADRMLVMSDFSKRSFTESGIPEEKVSVVTPGVDTELFRPAARPSDQGFRVLFAGVLTQRKGLSYLVEAFERAQLTDSELLLAGDPIGGGGPWIEAPRVRRLPWASPGRLAELFASASVLVLPSLVEGFARVVLEAMACGTPVVVTPNTGTADVVEDGVEGFVVPIRDSQAIAERLEWIQANPSRAQEMGRAARRRAEANSLAEYGRRIVGLIDDVASAR